MIAPAMILPSLELVLHSPLPPLRAAQALQDSLVTRRGWTAWLSLSLSGGGGFVGTVTESAFECERDVGYRNSFLPKMKGTFSPDAERGGSRVALLLALHPVVAAFMYMWLGLVLLFGVPIAIATLSDVIGGDGEREFGGAFVPVAMLAFGLVLPRLAFGYEAKKAVAFVKSTLSAQELEPPAR